jgi:hypothetical protein
MPPEKPKSAPITRAASIGLALGVTLAGIVLMFLALRTLNTQVECNGPDANECFFQQRIEQEFARWQLWIGVALELLAAGSFLWIRANDRKVARQTGADT